MLTLVAFGGTWFEGRADGLSYLLLFGGITIGCIVITAGRLP